MLLPAGVTPARVTHIQLTEGIVELVKEGLGISVLPGWSVAPQVQRGELAARPLTSGGRYRQWSAAWRAKPAPPSSCAISSRSWPAIRCPWDARPASGGGSRGPWSSAGMREGYEGLPADGRG